jgi:hypothetical protein
MCAIVFTTGYAHLAIFINVHSKKLKVLCFDTVSQVFILRGLDPSGDWSKTGDSKNFKARRDLALLGIAEAQAHSDTN